MKPAVTILGLSVQNNSSSMKIPKNTFSISHTEIHTLPGQPQHRIRTLYAPDKLQGVPSFLPCAGSQLLSSPHQRTQPQTEREEDCTPAFHRHSPLQKPLAENTRITATLRFIFKRRANAVILQIKYLMQLWHLNLDSGVTGGFY